MQEEVTLIEQAKTDPDAFGRLYDRYYQPVFGFMLSRTRNAEVAKDLCSETFFQALKNIRRYQSKGKPFKSWLFAIAMAQIGTYFRGRKKYLSVTIDEAPELVAADEYRPDVALAAEEDASVIRRQIRLVRRLFDMLSQRQQNILSLRFFSKLTVPEIAAVVKMKEGTVKSHIHRALKKLLVLMNEDEKSDHAAVVGDYERSDVGTNRTAFDATGAG
jgi:RNA polymerase sigma-70 factor (ECF subfamily)